MGRKKKEKQVIDPMAATYDAEFVPEIVKDAPPAKDKSDLPVSSLQKLRLNLISTLGSPWRVVYDVIERDLALLNFIEQENRLNDPRWGAVYQRTSEKLHHKLIDLDKVWKDLSQKRANAEQLRAFHNMELFLEYLSKINDFVSETEGLNEQIMKGFIDFLKTKDLFIE